MPSYSRKLKAFPYILIPYCVKAKSSGQTAATAVRYQDGPRRTGLGDDNSIALQLHGTIPSKRRRMRILTNIREPNENAMQGFYEAGPGLGSRNFALAFADCSPLAA